MMYEELHNMKLEVSLYFDILKEASHYETEPSRTKLFNSAKEMLLILFSYSVLILKA